MSGVRLAARTAAAAGAMSKFSGTTCLQEGEEALWAHSLHTDLPKHCTHKPRETAKEGFRKKRSQQIFTQQICRVRGRLGMILKLCKI